MFCHLDLFPHCLFLHEYSYSYFFFNVFTLYLSVFLSYLIFFASKTNSFMVQIRLYTAVMDGVFLCLKESILLSFASVKADHYNPIFFLHKNLISLSNLIALSSSFLRTSPFSRRKDPALKIGVNGRAGELIFEALGFEGPK